MVKAFMSTGRPRKVKMVVVGKKTEEKKPIPVEKIIEEKKIDFDYYLKGNNRKVISTLKNKYSKLSVDDVQDILLYEIENRNRIVIIERLEKILKEKIKQGD